MDGLPSLGWGNTLHRGNVLHFHPQHIPGMDAAGLRWGQRGNRLIEPPEQLGVFGLRFLFHQAILRRWLRPADGGLLNPIIAVKGVKRLVAVHLPLPGGLGPLVQQERLGDFIGHLHKGVLGAERVILFEVDRLHRPALTLPGKVRHSSGAYSAGPAEWQR